MRSQIPLTHYFYDLKDRVSNFSEVIIIHNNIPDPSRSTYGRKPTSSPEPVKITIASSQPSFLGKMWKLFQ